MTHSIMALQELKTEKWECLLCNRKTVDEVKYGPLMEKNSLVVHYYCLLFSCIEQNGKDEDGILGYLESDIVEYGRIAEANHCYYCSKSMASVQCSNGKCSAVFHFPCGLENGSMHQFKGRFNSYCFAHRPRQRVVKTIQIEAKQNPPICLICFDFVDSVNVIDVIWASCCRSTWYHRDCLQRFALSSGSLLKCLMCRNKTKFRSLVKRFGIYVPTRDASWEIVPGAYQELYVKHNQCDAMECKCPFGRNHVDDNWKHLLCGSCGGQGIHVDCADRIGCEWECEICRTVQLKFELPFQ